MKQSPIYSLCGFASWQWREWHAWSLPFLLPEIEEEPEDEKWDRYLWYLGPLQLSWSFSKEDI